MPNKNDEIYKWLNEQGYPLEMLVERYFREAGATVSQSAYYQDVETEKPREIDLIARWFKEIEKDNNVIECKLSLYIECKSQQDKPWIIFSSGMQKRNLPTFRKPPSTRSGNSLLSRVFFTSINKLPELFAMQQSMGHGITQAFTSKFDVPFQAVMSAAKAAIAEKINVEKYNEEYSDDGHYDVSLGATIAIPIIITDANLFECYLNQNSSPVLNNITSGCLEWKYPFESRFRSEPIPVYIYNKDAIHKLLTDIAELEKLLFASLPIILEEEIARKK